MAGVHPSGAPGFGFWIEAGHTGGQARNHLGNQAREGPPGAGGKPLAGPETTRARASLTTDPEDALIIRQANAREGFTE